MISNVQKLSFVIGFALIVSPIFADIKPGFLWYNLPPKEVKITPKEKTIPFKSLSFQQRDKVLHYLTMEALHKARQTHDVKDMERFLEYQTYWLNEASVFQHNFQYALLRKPDYDFTVKNPVSAIGTTLNEQRKSIYREKSISNLTQQYGLLFFYEGRSPYSEKQSYVLKDFAARYHFNYIPVSVDGVVLPTLPSSRVDKGQAQKLKIHTFPAMVLVEPKTGKSMPVAHGFVTQDYLTENFEVIAKELERSTHGEGVLYD
jgi:conjugal transfer pilus assembly protein TraF